MRPNRRRSAWPVVLAAYASGFLGLAGCGGPADGPAPTSKEALDAQKATADFLKANPPGKAARGPR